MVKNGIFEKYVASNKWCGVVGVPRGEEWKAGVPDNSRAVKDSAWGQYFERGSNKSNSIYAYSDNKDNKNFKVYFTVNKIADEYEGKGGTWSDYKFPAGDTWPGNEKPSYCKQWFENGLLDWCLKQERESFEGTIFAKNYELMTREGTRTASLHLYSDGGNSSNKNNYDGNSTAWIISHGMNNTWEDMRGLAAEIQLARPQAIIILVDWSGAREGVSSPTDTDQWIRPTAEVLAQKLKDWGIEDASELNLAGHSMGTMMINEIASQFSNNANGMYFLDPPNFFPGTDHFTVDDRPIGSNIYYNENNGYTQHYNRAAISRAFTGIKKNGDGNWCGNARLNRTAKESISIYFSSYKELWAPPLNDCKVHGNVHKTFGRLITDLKISFDGSYKLGLNGEGVESYPDTQFYEDDTNFDASITVLASDNIQTIMTRDASYSNQFNVWGKTGGTIYRNFDYYLPGAKNQKILNIKTFGSLDNNFDRISLEYNQSEALVVEDIVDNYRIQTINGKPTIYREVQRVEYNSSGILTSRTIISEFPEIVVEGRRGGEVTKDKLDSAYTGDRTLFNLR